MKRNFIAAIISVIALSSGTAGAQADFISIPDPDGVTTVYVGATAGTAWYSIDHNEKVSIPASRLGLKTNEFDWSVLELVGAQTDHITVDYTMDRGKTSHVCHKAATACVTFINPDGEKLEMEFLVSRYDVAFRYLLPKEGEIGSIRVLEELTEFNFSNLTDKDMVTGYLTSQSDAMTGWKRTKPSYEEYHAIDKPLSEKSQYGHGYTFPCLFRMGQDGWVLISETGVDSRYCGSRLSDSRLVNGQYFSYGIEYPMAEENNGNGTSEPAVCLPGATPWRTITIGQDLKPIVETTIAWDVVDPLYETVNRYEYGKGTWSWIVWQDASMNREDQTAYIDLAAEMGWDHILIDAGWDQNIGYEGMEELIAYAGSKDVDTFLWYSSSGWWNDIVQSPVNVMCNPIARKKEMRWMREQGVKGIKVDFFGGDKQETMRLYEAILSDADDHGLQVIFHGCTLPRGWERMYPNYVGSEAVRASENLVFNQQDCDQEAQAACLHPFIRNAVGSMEFGGCFLNERLDRTNSRGTVRRTTDLFQLATCILYQNPVQNFALTPNNLEDAPAACIEFLKTVPTTWDETRLIEGEPGKYVAMARRHGDTWYIAVVNAEAGERRFNVWEMVQVLKEHSAEATGRRWAPAKDTDVCIYEGGNEVVSCMLKASDIYKADITVPQNDGAIVTFKAALLLEND